MVHALWESHEWKSATEEQIIQALFNAPQFINPFDMEEIKRINPAAIRKYQVLFYGGTVPGYASNPSEPGVIQKLGLKL
jgi:hypothetical protein